MMENNSVENPKKLFNKEFFKTWSFWRPFLGVMIGGLAGFLYYYFIGCNSGSCAITSNPYNSIIFGGLFGFFMLNSPCSKGSC
jgi:hypothetical protein